MSKRYVFWRTPTGAAYKGQDNKHAPYDLLAQIGKLSSVNADGKVTYDSLFPLRFEHAVLGSIILIDQDGRELNQQDSQDVLRKAMSSVIKKKDGKIPIDATALLRESDIKAAAFFQKEQEPFSLVTSVSIKSFPANQLSVNKCRVMPLKNRTHFPLPDQLRTVLSTDASQSLVGRKQHQLVRVKTLGRSWSDAKERALDSLRLLCGLWNLFGTKMGSWSLSFVPRKRTPLGVVHVGPYHTLHSKSGKSIGDLYWYETEYGEHPMPFEPHNGWANTEKLRRWALNKLRHSPYGSDLSRLIIRYASALSNPDLNVAFLQMWSILELITNSVGAKYEATVKRATWILPDRKLSKELLEYLRCYRNQYVHSARSSESSYQIAQLIKSIIDRHLLFLLRNDFRVESLEEYAACLSLPTSADQLKRRCELDRRALAILKILDKN